LRNGFIDRDSEPTGKDGNEHVGINRKQQDLKNGVKSHQSGGILPVSLGKIVPDDHHGDAPGKANEDDPVHIRQIGILLSGEEFEKGDGQSEHQYRAQHPVLE